MDAIKMTGIVKCFGSVRANDGIDFSVKEQEIHCLLGENGTGKSTLMNILFGLYHPDEGEIYIHGKKRLSQIQTMHMRWESEWCISILCW